MQFSSLLSNPALGGLLRSPAALFIGRASPSDIEGRRTVHGTRYTASPAAVLLLWVLLLWGAVCCGYGQPCAASIGWHYKRAVGLFAIKLTTVLL